MFIRIRVTLLSLSIVFFLSLSFLSASPPARAQIQLSPTTAISTNAFINTMGVDTHYDYVGTQWGNVPLLNSLLGNLGIKNVRDGSDRQPVWDGWYNDLYKAHGIRITANFTPASYWTISDMIALLKSHPEIVAGIEGPNEPDVSSQYTYNGQSGVPAIVSFQNDLYAAVKSDPVTRAMPVLSPPMAHPENTANYAPLASFDYESMHSYQGGALPDDQLTDYWIPLTNKIVGAGNPPKPIIVTETGYITDTSPNPPCGVGQPGVSEAAQAKYLVRLFGDNYIHGILRTFIYELIDGGGPEACWGLVRNDGSLKPSYVALKNLISQLSDAGPSFTPSALSYAVTGAPDTVHQLLLQKSNRDFYLLVWNDVLSYDTKAHHDITNAPVPVQLSVDPAINQAAITTFDAQGNSVPVAGALANHQLNVNVTDTMTIIKLAAAPVVPTATTVPGTATALPPTAGAAVASSGAANNTTGGSSSHAARSGGNTPLVIVLVAMVLLGGGGLVFWLLRRRRRADQLAYETSSAFTDDDDMPAASDFDWQRHPLWDEPF